MRLKLNSWMDNWFLSSAENPEKRDTLISRYESARMIGAISLVVVLAMLWLVLFMSEKGPEHNTLIWDMFLLVAILHLHADVYTKILKLQRQQEKRGTKDPTPRVP